MHSSRSTASQRPWRAVLGKRPNTTSWPELAGPNESANNFQSPICTDLTSLSIHIWDILSTSEENPSTCPSPPIIRYIQDFKGIQDTQRILDNPMCPIPISNSSTERDAKHQKSSHKRTGRSLTNIISWIPSIRSQLP
ncbi:uncharacterized protein [Macrobrachium rosenbergii]|uniref:uncharacterized protein n=1 Tax=Macrobrachium rosenbergii TaxID=79674 RepID=UPI0034D3D9EA